MIRDNCSAHRASTATPQHFYESLSNRMLTNGCVARLSIIDVGRRGAGQTPGSARNVPDSILEIAQWWADFQPGSGNLQGFHPEPREVSFDPDAAQAVELTVRAIQYSSLAGENVLDLFGGSGSTLIACEQTGRKAFLMELDA